MLIHNGYAWLMGVGVNIQDVAHGKSRLEDDLETLNLQQGLTGGTMTGHEYCQQCLYVHIDILYIQLHTHRRDEWIKSMHRLDMIDHIERQDDTIYIYIYTYIYIYIYIFVHSSA